MRRGAGYFVRWFVFGFRGKVLEVLEFSENEVVRVLCCK